MKKNTESHTNFKNFIDLVLGYSFNRDQIFFGGERDGFHCLETGFHEFFYIGSRNSELLQLTDKGGAGNFFLLFDYFGLLLLHLREFKIKGFLLIFDLGIPGIYKMEEEF